MVCLHSHFAALKQECMYGLSAACHNLEYSSSTIYSHGHPSPSMYSLTLHEDKILTSAQTDTMEINPYYM